MIDQSRRLDDRPDDSDSSISFSLSRAKQLEIQQHLLQLNPIRPHWGQFSRQFEFDFYITSGQLGMNASQKIGDYIREAATLKGVTAGGKVRMGPVPGTLFRNSSIPPNDMITNKCAQPLLIIAMALMSVLAIGHAEERKLRIVYSSPALTYPWQAEAAKVAQDEARELDVDLLVQDGEASSPKQEGDLRAALNLGVDGIVLDPNDVDALTGATNDVLDAGIPIVTFDRIVRNPHKPIPYFGLNNVAAGGELAKYVINKLPDGARIVFITGKPGGSSANERAKGVHDIIKAAGDKYKIVAEQTGNWSREEALNVTQDVLTSLGYTPDAVIAANDDMALGALAAIEQAGIAKGKIVVVGIDGLPEALAKIRDGEMAASVQFPLMQVRLALEALVAHLRDHKVIEGKLLEALVIEKSNLQQADRYSAIKYD